MANKYRSLAERFDRFVVRHDGCWEWLGSQYESGHGSISVNGRLTRASRVSWILHGGPIPDGLSVLHSCDNPPCTNPGHLFLGTQAENMLDMISKGRAAHQRDPVGFALKVSNGQPRKIGKGEHEKIRLSPVRTGLLAAEYGVHPATVRRIRALAAKPQEKPE